MSTAASHVRSLISALEQLDAERVEQWGARIGSVLAVGGRLLAVGNGGSAAQAEHLTAELVGRFDGERRALAAVALGSEFATLTALVNDYGATEALARSVIAHGRPGDVVVALSTSGRSSNVIAAVQAAHHAGLTTLALTGPRPNPLAEASDDALSVPAEMTATVQEVHQVMIHLLCRGIDASVRSFDEARVPA